MKKALVCALLALTSCSEVDRMKDMQQSTDSMAGTTKSMAATTAGMATTTTGMASTTQQLQVLTDGMSKTTDSLYQDLRQGNSVTSRQDQLRAMQAAKTQEEKLRAAGVYMMGFEFQVWTGQGLDDEARRESLFNDLFIEFDLDVRNYIHTDQLSLDPTSQDDDMMNLYAMAATMHMMNPMQETLVANNPAIQSYSVLSLIEEALRENTLVEAGKMQVSDLKPWVLQALRTPKDLVYMIQLRANFVPMLVMSNFTNLEYAGFLGQAKHLATGFTADFSDLGVVAMSTYSDYLKDANANRDFLVSIGSSPDYNCLLDLLYTNMSLPNTKTLSAPKRNESVELLDEIEEFKNPKTGLPKLTAAESDGCMGSSVLSKLNPVHWF